MRSYKSHEQCPVFFGCIFMAEYLEVVTILQASLGTCDPHLSPTNVVLNIITCGIFFVFLFVMNLEAAAL
jgi:hypothetical protein